MWSEVGGLKMEDKYYCQAKEILDQMTISEKCRMLACDAKSIFGEIERLGVRGFDTKDTPAGNPGRTADSLGSLRQSVLVGRATTYPHFASLAATWNCKMAERIGKATAEEAKTNEVGIVFRPPMNIKRHPQCGRHFEYLSEDPVHSGEIAGSYIIGLQRENVGACVKHFCCNNQEFERVTTNAVVSERALREIYLRNFEIAIEKGHPWSMMTSYNKINGEWSNDSDHIMTDILRKEWNYDGLVMSDGGAIQTNKVEAHKRALDVELNRYEEHTPELLNAYNEGKISLEKIEEHCLRVLAVYFKLREHENDSVEYTMEQHHALAVEACEDGIVMLENDGILPLKNYDKVALIGAFAKEPVYCGGGSGHSNAISLSNAYDCFAKAIGEEKLLYAQGYHNNADIVSVDETLICEAKEAAKKAEAVIMFIGDPDGVETEGFDRKNIELPMGQQELIKAVAEANSNIVLVASVGSATLLEPYAKKARALLINWMGGEGVGEATTNVLLGKAEPGGRLPETIPLDIRHTPAYRNFAIYPNPTHNIMYGEGIYVGYRWYEMRGLPVAYPFGYGMSYTTFTLDDLSVKTYENIAEGVDVSVKVTNTGKRFGSQVVQLYVKDVESSIDRPEKELKAFDKVFLEPGESRIVTMHLTKRAFEYYSEDLKEWMLETGAFDIMVGFSSQEILLTEEISLKGLDYPVRFSRMTAIEWFMKHPRWDEAVSSIPGEAGETLKKMKEDPFTFIVSMLPIYRLASEKSLEGSLVHVPLEYLDQLIERLNEFNE